MKTPITFQVASTKPFSDGKFLNFTANGPTGQFEGIAWEQADHGKFHIGATITVLVGTTKADGAFWNNYKGKNRLEISKGAEWGQNAPQAAQAAPAAQYQQPAQQAAPAASPAQYGPPQGYKGDNYGKGEDVLTRAADLTAYYRDRLVERGFPQDVANEHAGRAPEIISSWWFGERSA